MVTDGDENASTATPESAVVDSARANSIPLFTIGVGTITLRRHARCCTRLREMTRAANTSLRQPSEIAAAYTRIADRLNNEYLLTVPSTITDCNDHTIFVDVTGQAVTGQTFDASATFARCSAPTSIAVPNVTGQTQAAATSAITGAGLTVGGVTQQSSSTVASGSVISQSPAAGTSVASGSAVSLVVSSGSGGGGGGSSGGGGGGGGAMGGAELLPALLALLVARRRGRWTWTARH